MLNLAAALLLFVGGTWFFGEFVPNRMAQRDEQRREVVFRRLQIQIRERVLPICPARGPALDQFLMARERDESSSKEMWRPLCYFERFPDAIVTLVVSDRSELRSCEETREMIPTTVTCDVEEPVRFLSHPEARRTWARREHTDERGRLVLWISGRPMAWRDHLVAESRVMISAFFCGLVGALSVASPP